MTTEKTVVYLLCLSPLVFQRIGNRKATARYVLTSTGDLFLRKVPNPARGVTCAYITTKFGSYVDASNLENFMNLHIATRKLIAGVSIEPDIYLSPTRRWDVDDTMRPRGLIEIEYKYRGTDESREQGYGFLNESHYHRFYMLIRIYKKRMNGTFAGACVLWRKDTVHVPVVATPSPLGADPLPHSYGTTVAPIGGLTIAASPIANAALAVPIVGGILNGVGFQWGTAPMDTNGMNSFTAAIGPGYLPPAAFHPFVGPHTANHPAFLVPIPAIDIFYLIRDANAALVFPNPAPNCSLDLGSLQTKLEPIEFDDADE